jgi:hypothetical protein
MREDVVASPVTEAIRDPVQLLKWFRVPGVCEPPLLEADDPLFAGPAKVSVRFVALSPVRFALRIQPVDATHSLNIAAGVWKPNVLRGLSFNCLAIALS